MSDEQVPNIANFRSDKILTVLNRISRIVTFLIIAAICLGYTYLFFLLNSNYFPPGVEVAYLYGKVREFVQFPMQGIPNIMYLFTSFLAGLFYFDLLLSLKVFAAVSIALLVLVVYQLGRSLSRSRFSGLLTALTYPVLFPNILLIISGEYDILMALPLAGISILFALRILEIGARPIMLVPVVTLLVLTLTLDSLVFVMILFTLFVGIVLSPQEKDRRNLYMTAIVMVISGLAIWIRYRDLSGLRIVPSLNMITDGGKLLPLAALVVIGLIGTTVMLSSGQIRRLLVFLPLVIISTLGYLTGLHDLEGTLSFLLIVITPIGFTIASPTRVRISRSGTRLRIILRPMKIIATVLSILITLVFLTALPTNLQEAYGTNSLPMETSESDFQKLLEEMRKGGCPSPIFTYPILASWISSFTSCKTVDSAFFKEVYEHLSSYPFRIETPYLRVEESQPRAAARAPVISAYDGRRYVPLLNVDDSLARAVLTSKGKDYWVESPYKHRYLGYAWKKSEGGDISLDQSFATDWMIIRKHVGVESERAVILRYQFMSRAGSEFPSAQLPIWLEWQVQAKDYRVVEDTIELTLTNGFKARIQYLSRPESLEIIVKGDGQWGVVANYESGGRNFTMQARVEVLGGSRRSAGVETSSIYEIMNRLDIRYIVLPITDIQNISSLLVRNIDTLSIKDAFLRTHFRAGGSDWVEAPYGATVIEENRDSKGTEARQLVKYASRSLYFTKILQYSSRDINMTYVIAPKDKEANLSFVETSLWINWNRQILGQTVSDNIATLNLDSGDLRIEFGGKNHKEIRVEIGEDSEHRQSRIWAKIPLKADGDAFSILIRGSAEVILENQLTTRPIMTGDDSLNILMENGTYKELISMPSLKMYSNNKYE